MKRLFIFSVVLLSACAGTSIQPRMGMTLDELNRMARPSPLMGGAGCQELEMVAGQGNMAIYHVRNIGRYQAPGCNPNIFYYFEDGKLVKVDQGQLYEQRYKIDINR